MKITWKLIYAIAVSISLVTLLVYLPALRNDYVGVWDDNTYIVENPHIRSLDAAFFRWAFFDFYASNWHPITWISLAVDRSLWGLNPFGYHFTNIILHTLNTLAVVLLIVKLLQTAGARKAPPQFQAFLSERTTLVVAGATGLLFGLHPVHVESVAWAAERKDLLCALFYLLSILSYISYVSYRSYKTYLLTFGVFILALLSKPMAVSLPAVLLILDWYPFGRIRNWETFWSSGVEKLPFIVASVASSIITVLAQSSGESVASLELVPVSSRMLVAVWSLIAYLGKMLLPLNLVPFYPYPKDVSLFSIEYLSAIFLSAGITLICLVIAKKQKAWLAIWGYYGVTLIPVLGIVQVGNQAMADRYMYLPSIGPFLASALIMAWLAEKVNTRHRSGKIPLFIYTVLALCLFFSLSYITIKQTGIWKNGFVLWNHTLEKGFESAAAYNNRGLSLDEMGQRDKAIVDFERAITLDPQNYFAYNNMGVLYGKNGQYRKSLEYLLKAIAINPKHADSYCNLGLSFFNIKQYDNALENYNEAIRLKPDFDTAYLNRGNLYYTVGDSGLALADYRKACILGNGKACEILDLVSRERFSE